MIERVLKAIETVEVIKGPVNKKLEAMDKKIFDSFANNNDPDLVGSENISDFDELLEVLARPVHFENLFWYKEAVVFLSNPLHLNSLPDMNIEIKQRVQNELRKLHHKIIEVYDARVTMKDGWWYDEVGVISGGISKMARSIEDMISKFIIHIPHAGLEIPEAFRGDYHLDDKELERNIYQYADFKTDKLYGALTAKHDSIINPYSRFFIDPERFFDDEQERMHLENGLGWFYENSVLEKKPLRSTRNKEKVAEYYHAYHARFTALVEEKLQLFGECVIIDCHSFSNELYWFQAQDMRLPDVCIGYDEFHKDDDVIEKIMKCFSDQEVCINTPYSGSLVPNRFYMKDKRVKSVMIEINKKLYLDEDNVTVTNKFIPYRARLAGMF